MTRLCLDFLQGPIESADDESCLRQSCEELARGHKIKARRCISVGLIAANR
jgi:hypothetical protein